MLRFDLLHAPREDGQVLIEPAVSTWRGLIEDHVRAHSATHEGLLMAGVPLGTVRRQTRQRLFGLEPSAGSVGESPAESGGRASSPPGIGQVERRAAGRDPALRRDGSCTSEEAGRMPAPQEGQTVQPTTALAPLVIACGHQPEFIHPGVWAKNVVVHHVARAAGTHGAILVVDNDAPRSTGLTVPAIDAEGYITARVIPLLNGVAAAAYEGRSPLEPAAIEALQRGVGSAASDSVIGEYCRGLATAAHPRDFVEQHLAARAGIDRTLGADLHELRVSRAFDGPFVADVLLNLERFARDYNASLAAYRHEQRVRGVDRPLPDLKRDGDRIEAPFWIYQPLQQRRRLWVAGRHETVVLHADAQAIAEVARRDLLRDPTGALAGLSPWVVRPRSLTLTLWARLLVCDLFVHGIGGAK
ncbi:MAG: hypothetical protein HY718_00570, partial [Planctomycetes bacterium]|nr:hypothetical protein [Planctomycetota bacterium]